MAVPLRWEGGGFNGTAIKKGFFRRLSQVKAPLIVYKPKKGYIVDMISTSGAL